MPGKRVLRRQHIRRRELPQGLLRLCLEARWRPRHSKTFVPILDLLQQPAQNDGRLVNA